MDLRELAPVLTADGPFVTVHVDSESRVERAAPKYDLEWKNVLRELGDLGVDRETLQAIERAKGDHAEGGSRLVVATPHDHSVKLAVSLPDPPAGPVVDVAPLPHLLPLVKDLRSRVPYVVLLVDRTGADLWAWYDERKTAGLLSLQGSSEVQRSPKDSSWVHLQHQHQVEAAWETSVAKDVVALLTRVSDHVRPELVLAVGDDRELAEVRAHLPGSLRDRWQELPGSRAADGGKELVAQRARDAVARHVALRTLDLMERYAEERGQLVRACEGVVDTVAALRKAQVETLLLTTRLPESCSLWFGPEPLSLATSASELRELGVDEPIEGPLVDVLLRAAIASDADVEVVPHELDEAPHEGVGALLRYADSDTGTTRS